MQLIVRMQIVQTKQQLPQNNRNILLRQLPRAHQVRAASTGAKLHDDPQIRALEERAMVLCHVRRVELGQDRDLLDDVLDFVVCAFDVDDLDCDGLAGAFVDAGMDKGIVSIHSHIGARREKRGECKPFINLAKATST